MAPVQLLRRAQHSATERPLGKVALCLPKMIDDATTLVLSPKELRSQLLRLTDIDKGRTLYIRQDANNMQYNKDRPM